MAVTQVGTPSSPVVGSASPATGSWSGSQPRTAGDLLVAVVIMSAGTSTSTITGPGGIWISQIEKAGNNRARVAIFTGIAAGGDAAPSFTSTLSGGASTGVYLYEFTGHSPYAQVMTTGSTSATSSPASLTDTTAAAINAAGSYAISAWAQQGGTSGTLSWTPGASWTNDAVDGTTSTRHFEVDHLANPPIGSTLSELGTGTSGGANMTNWGAVILAITPAPLPLFALQTGSQQYKQRHYRTQVMIPSAPVTSLTVTAGLATATGAALDNTTATAFGIGLTPPVSSGTGAAQAVGGGLTSGLATGAGQVPFAGTGLTPGLASGTGAAQSPSGQFTNTAGLATGTGAAQAPGIGLTPGLASGTGAAQQPEAGVSSTAGLATGTGAAQAPGIGLTPGLASGTGAAQAVGGGLTSGLATGSGQVPFAGTGLTPGLAAGTGAAQAPGMGWTAGLSTGSGVAQIPGIGLTPGLASGSGAAQQPGVFTGRSPLNLGGTATPVFPYNATNTPVTYDGTAQLVSLDSTSGGSASIASLDSTSGGSATLVSLDSTSGGTLTTSASTLGGSVAYGNVLGGSLIGWTMQQVNLTLAENNDETVNFAITSNGSALSLSGATINVYFKTAAGTTDGSALMFSSGGGSPAITITNSSGGLCSLAIPHSDLYPETYTFYRLDVVFSGLQNTAIYGNITWITL